MFARRSVLKTAAALLGAAALRPKLAWAQLLGGTQEVSPLLSVLADRFEAAGKRYEAARFAAFFEDMPKGEMRGYLHEAPALELYRSTCREYLAAIDVLMREPSRTIGDVILKYHVMDDVAGWRVVTMDEALAEAGGRQWHLIVEREAAAFGVNINPFWYWESPDLPRIDGDPNSPKWAVVSRWRTSRYKWITAVERGAALDAAGVEPVGRYSSAIGA